MKWANFLTKITKNFKVMKMTSEAEKVWRKPDGSLVSCTEKIKVLNENYEEIKTLLQDAIDDAVLMGCSEENVRVVYLELVNSIKSVYKENKKEPC